jgi:hypothetical protein
MRSSFIFVTLFSVVRFATTAFLTARAAPIP